MHALLSKLPAFVVPFVTRSLRGGRGRRYIIFSLLLASMTGIFGLWLTLGSGQFEQSIRTDIGFEQYEYERERANFTLYVHEDLEGELAADELARIVSSPPTRQEHDDQRDYDRYYGEATELYEHGRELLTLAAISETTNPKQRQLREQASAVLGHTTPPQIQVWEEGDPWQEPFPWYDASAIESLENVIASAGMPTIERYSSELSGRDALAFTGFLAGLILAGLATVFAPLLVAVQQAQERHENTLMPLTGTALSPRELALGLASGPSAVIAIFALPQLAIFILCAGIAGEPGVALALLAALLTTSAVFVFGGQLLGQLIGHKRTPGIIGIALMGLAGSSWLASAAIVASGERAATGFSAVLPQVGLSSLLAEVFIDLPTSFSAVFIGSSSWTLAAVVLAYLTLTALARRMEGTEGPLLTRAQAGVGALIGILLVAVAFPDITDEAGVRQYMGIAILAVPFLGLLMARVPAGDGPPRMRKIPVPALLLEYATWIAAHFLLSAVLFGTKASVFHPIALAWLSWCIAVSGLIAIRTVAVPSKVAANIWAGFCFCTVMVGFVHAAIWGIDGSSADKVFFFFELSPVLGLVQVALFFWIPISLVRHLRKNLGSLL